MRFLPAHPSGLIRAADVTAAGARGELAAEIAATRIERVRRGVYASALGQNVEARPAERDAQRYRRNVLAAAMTMREPVFTSFSAIALLRLPIVGRWPTDIFAMSGRTQGDRRHGVAFVGSSVPHGVTAIDGCSATSVEFSLIQLARHATLSAALVATDAALFMPRSMARPVRSPLTTIGALWTEFERMLPFRGSRRVRAVLERAVDGAQTPLETISRLVIEELGFAPPELQHGMWLDELGSHAWLDFYWPSVNAGGEADGHGKYVGSSDGAAAAVIREKDRENALRRRLRAFDRWDWMDSIRRAPLAVRLESMAIPRVRRQGAQLIAPLSAPAARTPRRPPTS